MFITDKFVVLYFPKTGTTFMRKVMHDVYVHNRSILTKGLHRTGLLNRPFKFVKVPTLYHGFHFNLTRHGTKRQIPIEDNHKPIISIVRDPFTRYVSQYLYGWWKTNIPKSKDLLRDFPEFPNLSFEQFYHMNHKYGNPILSGEPAFSKKFGEYSRSFVRFFFEKPNDIFFILQKEDNYDELNQNLYSIHFLHQNNLNSELVEMFELFDPKKSEMAKKVIKKTEKLNTSNKHENKMEYRDYYKGNQIAQLILDRDSLLFKLFPCYLNSRCL